MFQCFIVEFEQVNTSWAPGLIKSFWNKIAAIGLPYQYFWRCVSFNYNNAT